MMKLILKFYLKKKKKREKTVAFTNISPKHRDKNDKLVIMILKIGDSTTTKKHHKNKLVVMP